MKMLNQFDYSSVWSSIFYLFLRAAQRATIQPLYNYLLEGRAPPEGAISKKLISMRIFMDSFEILRCRTRYGPLETNSVLDFEKVPLKWENHFMILLQHTKSSIETNKHPNEPQNSQS